SGGLNGFVNAIGADVQAFGLNNVIEFTNAGGPSVTNLGRFALTGTPLGGLAINPISGQAFLNAGDFFIDPSAVTIGIGGGGLFTNTGNTELANSSLTSGSITNEGTIDASGAPPVGLAISTGAFNNTSGTFLARGG